MNESTIMGLRLQPEDGWGCFPPKRFQCLQNPLYFMGYLSFCSSLVYSFVKELQSKIEPKGIKWRVSHVCPQEDKI